MKTIVKLDVKKEMRKGVWEHSSAEVSNFKLKVLLILLYHSNFLQNAEAEAAIRSKVYEEVELHGPPPVRPLTKVYESRYKQCKSLIQSLQTLDRRLGASTGERREEWGMSVDEDYADASVSEKLNI